MIYNVIENSTIINTIVADEKFAESYAESTGYTLEPLDPGETDLPAPAPMEQLRADVDYLAALQGVVL